MVLLRVPVSCFRCGEVVDRSQTLVAGKRYECFSCYKQLKNSPWLIRQKLPEKLELYCECCRYRFKSKRLVCPYCDKEDRVVRGQIEVSDLL